MILYFKHEYNPRDYYDGKIPYISKFFDVKIIKDVKNSKEWTDLISPPSSKEYFKRENITHFDFRAESFYEEGYTAGSMEETSLFGVSEYIIDTDRYDLNTWLSYYRNTKWSIEEQHMVDCDKDESIFEKFNIQGNLEYIITRLKRKEKLGEIL